MATKTNQVKERTQKQVKKENSTTDTTDTKNHCGYYK